MRPTSPRPPAPPAPGTRARARGFTMTELLVSLTIVAILVGIGVPSYQNVTTSNRVSTEINALLYDIQFARAEAIKQGTPVSVCASWDGQHCLGFPWYSGGWIVFEDRNASGTVDAGEAVLRVQKMLPHNDFMWPDLWVSAVTFNREGFAFGLPGTVTLHLHDGTWNNAYTRCLQITLVGQVQTERFGTGACLW